MNQLATVPNRLDLLDAWLSADDLYRIDPAEARQMCAQFLREAIERHCAANPHFARYVDRLGFDPSALSADTLGDLPYIPSALFKNAPELIRCSPDEAVATTSSGTQGSVSTVYRDNLTMMRFFASVATGVRDLLDIEHAEMTAHNLGPTVEDSEHLWIAYVMAGVSVMHDSEFYVRDGKLDRDYFIEQLRDEEPGHPVVVVGPPPLIMEVAQHLDERGGLPPSAERWVITIGGWKRRDNERIRQDAFDELVVRGFGLPDRSSIRDVFNMVELNTVIFECRARRKHCPPWLYVSARNPRNLAELPSGDIGVLAYADPTPQSFPGLVISDDFGKVDREVECECGIRGDVLTVERRINRIESRGCAMKI